MDKLSFTAKHAYAEKKGYGYMVVFADSDSPNPKDFIIFQRALEEDYEGEGEHMTVHSQDLYNDSYNLCKQAVLSSDKLAVDFAVESKDYHLEVSFDKAVIITDNIKDILHKALGSKLVVK